MPKPKKPKPRRTKARNGEGMIRQRADGRWEIRVAGKAAYARSETEAIEKRAMMLLNSGKAQGISSQLTFGQICKAHYAAREQEGARPNTLTSYRTYMIHLEALFDTPAQKLTIELLEAHFRAMSRKHSTKTVAGGKRDEVKRVDTGKPLSKAMLDHAWWFGKAALKRAQRYGYVSFNPFELAQRPKLKHAKRARILTAEDETALLKAAQAKGQQMHGIVYLALALGLRRGEVLGLTWEAVDFSRGTLHIYQAVTTNIGKVEVTGTKTESSNRTLPLPQGVRRVLEAIHLEQHHPTKGWVFHSEAGNPLNPHNVLREYRKALEAAKLPAIRFHDLRHTFTSRAVKSIGVKATSTILGHSNVQQTLDVYTHISAEDLKQAMGILEGEK